jgi:hypothetical protein
MAKRVPVVRDVNDPRFPHGTPTGYSRGCPKECCLRARRRREKQLQIGVVEPTSQTAPAADIEKARKHVTLLVETLDVSLGAIARGVDLGESVVQGLMRGRNVGPETVRKILSATATNVTSASHVVPIEQVLLMVGQMQALGYSVAWQDRASGLNGIIRSFMSMHAAGKQSTVDHRTAKAVKALHARVGDRPATPEDGTAKFSITLSKRLAASRGFYPPVFYDEDGTLDWRAIPDHPWTIIEEQCHEHIARLEMALKHPDVGARGLTHITLDYTEDDHEPGTPEHTEFSRVEMAYRRLLEGLRIRNSDTGPERRAELHEALWRFMHKGEGDPVSFCIKTGILSAKSSKIPSDHPAVAKARAKAAEERKKARKASNRGPRSETAKATRRAAEAAKRAAFTPEEREAYNQRKRDQRRNARTEQVAA